jgi:hypothetical protein|tara:strand:+ start:6953 stop:7162 length:210 start_codon:yes stop_codon:yes gene_type:complete
MLCGHLVDAVPTLQDALLEETAHTEPHDGERRPSIQAAAGWRSDRMWKGSIGFEVCLRLLIVLGAVSSL